MGKTDISTYGNLAEIIRQNAGHYGDNRALSFVNGISYTYLELHKLTVHIARMLYALGVSEGDRVAIYSENNPHWGASYFGILAAGAVTVPILPDFHGKEVSTIIEHSESRILIISGKLFEKLKNSIPSTVSHLIFIETFTVAESDGSGFPDGLTDLDFRKIEVDDEQAEIHPSFYRMGLDDLASIIYTSGTTGRSKGVMLTNRNILFDAYQSRTMHSVFPEDVFLSVLPLAHTLECTIGMVVPLIFGASVYYIDRAPTASYLAPVLQSIKPTTMLTVPIIIEKIFRLKIKPALYKSPLMRFMMHIGPVRRTLSKAAGRKLLQFFGGRLRFFGIGGAPLAPEVERFLFDSGFPYAIGYGLTETSPLLSGFNPSQAVFRSVGKVLEGVEIRIGDADPVTGEGEIQARGPIVMPGYYLDEERTREVFTEDGFFRTGDLGFINSNDVIFIRGRLKNMILGPNGENIYPEEIEAIINEREYVNESLVMQYKGKLVARVHLNVELIEEKLEHLKSNAIEFQEQVTRRTEEILEELKEYVNDQVAKNSRLQLILQEIKPFEKTPTLKIKRYLYS